METMKDAEKEIIKRKLYYFQAAKEVNGRILIKRNQK